MTSLGYTVYYARKFLFFGLPVFVLMIIGGTLFVSIINKSKPPVVEVKPTPAAEWGKIPRLVFPVKQNNPHTYKLETISGLAPVSTDSSKIYFLQKKPTTLFSRKNALNLATKLGFSPPFETIDDTTYAFTNPEGDRLTVESANMVFTFKKQGSSYPTAGTVVLPAEDVIKSLADGYFTKAGTSTSAFDKKTVTYFDVQNGQFIPVKRIRDATVVRVDYFHSKINEVPIVTSDQNRSSTYILFSPQDQNNLGVYEASFQNWYIDPSIYGTYPTISGEQAWNELALGKGFISKDIEKNDVVVRDGYFAYYQPYDYVPYLQPVYVFKGDGEFEGYLPAIDPSWLTD
jgi:hypothetical protein